MIAEKIFERDSVQALKGQWNDAKPTAHIIIDGFIHPEQADVIAALDFSRGPTLALKISDLKNEIHSAGFRETLERITSTDGLIADENLEGAGAILVPASKQLYSPPSFMPHRMMHRRMTLLYFADDADGDFELWALDRESYVDIPIQKNRVVIFDSVGCFQFFGADAPVFCCSLYLKEAQAGLARPRPELRAERMQTA